MLDVCNIRFETFDGFLQILLMRIGDPLKLDRRSVIFKAKLVRRRINGEKHILTRLVCQFSCANSDSMELFQAESLDVCPISKRQ